MLLARVTRQDANEESRHESETSTKLAEKRSKAQSKYAFQNIKDVLRDGICLQKSAEMLRNIYSPSYLRISSQMKKRCGSIEGW